MLDRGCDVNLDSAYTYQVVDVPHFKRRFERIQSEFNVRNPHPQTFPPYGTIVAAPPLYTTSLLRNAPFNNSSIKHRPELSYLCLHPLAVVNSCSMHVSHLLIIATEHLSLPNTVHNSWFILGSFIASNIHAALCFANCDILGVKIIRMDPLESNIWLSYVSYAVWAAVL